MTDVARKYMIDTDRRFSQTAKYKFVHRQLLKQKIFLICGFTTPIGSLYYNTIIKGA